MRPKRKGIMSFIMGSEDKKGALENIADFIHNLMKPSANRQEKLLSDIVTRLEALNEKKMNDTMRNTWKPTSLFGRYLVFRNKILRKEQKI